MKTILNLFGVLLIPFLVSAQIENQSSDLLEEVSNLTYATLNPENQVTSETFYEVTSSFNILSGKKVVLMAKEKPLEDPVNATYNYIEQDKHGMTLNIRNIVPAFMFDLYSNMQINLASGDFQVPVAFNKDQLLPDITLKISASITPIIHTLEYNLKERRVVKKETVKTTAGTFECLVIESKTHFLPKSDKDGSLTQWFAPGIGLIKQMHYDKNGVMTGLTLLTGINTTEVSSGFAQN
ncbi:MULTISPECIES: hypothetical protein [unclassified Leeuwenhoekiella]|uniref:TapB family protein n=1 Tax=unclassified Leeuwenhoekiella TaxID=2615029 RepID=UPI0025C72973|nr:MULTISPECIES: hypothetical protein [unclassified Leeuwenhoekiella]